MKTVCTCMCVNRCVNELKRDGAKKRREKAMRHVMMIIGLCLRIDHSIQIYQDIGEDQNDLLSFESFRHFVRNLKCTCINVILHKKQKTFIKKLTCNHGGDMQSYTSQFMIFCVMCLFILVMGHPFWVVFELLVPIQFQ